MSTNKAVVLFTCDRGEDFTGFDIYGLPEGDAMDASMTVECQLKIASYGNSVPPSSEPSKLTMTTTFVAATDDQPPRFVCSMSDVDTAQLIPTTYITTPKVTLSNGTVVIGDPVAIQVRETTS